MYIVQLKFTHVKDMLVIYTSKTEVMDFMLELLSEGRPISQISIHRFDIIANCGR